MELNEAQIQELREQLDKTRKDLEKSLAEAKKTSAPVELDQQAFGRVSRIDAIQQQQMQAASVRRMEQQLQMIQNAQKRIDSHAYGFCVQCEEPIQFKRLKVKPESTLCVQCASKK